MLRVPIHNIQSGMVLARPIPSPNGPSRCLLRRDEEIPADLIRHLPEFGVKEVWVRHQGLEFLDSLFDDDLSDLQREVYYQVRRNFEAIVWDSCVELDVIEFRESISDLFDFLINNPGSNVLLQKLDSFDNYLLSHSVNMSYLAMLTGLKLGQSLIERRGNLSIEEASSVKMLGLGCLLHDIGKLRVPIQILSKPGRLDPIEMEEIKQHSLYGYQMAKGSVPESVAEIVLNHHQRYDGNGYPDQYDPETGERKPPLKGEDIPLFARIACITDVYDAVTSHRCYSASKLPVQVLAEMQTRCRGFFDPVIELAFREIISPFPIGQIVTLSDGVEAVVVDFTPKFPTQPKIQCLRTPDGKVIATNEQEEIDLAIFPELEIVCVDGVDVRPFTSILEERPLLATS